MPILDNVTKLQSFLGLANYYNLYIPNMHELRGSLNKLLSRNKKWYWTKECNNAFNKIKKCLLSDLALAYYDSKKELIVASDASDYGIGTVLLPRFEDGITKPTAHASRALLPAERYYSQIEKAGLSITYAVKKCHSFIHCRTFVLQTDHKPLLSISGSKKGVPTHSVNWLQRQSVILLNYNFKIQYMSSKKIAHVGGLSRLILDNAELLEETVIAALRQEQELKGV